MKTHHVGIMCWMCLYGTIYEGVRQLLHRSAGRFKWMALLQNVHKHRKNKVLEEDRKKKERKRPKKPCSQSIAEAAGLRNRDVQAVKW